MVLALCVRDFLCCLLKGIGKRDIVKEGPWIVEFVVPRGFQLLHGGNEVVKFFITDEGEEGGIDTGGIKGVGFIVVVCVSP